MFSHSPLSEKKKLDLPLLLLFLVVIGAIIRLINLDSMFLYWDEPIHSIRIDYQPFAYVVAHNNASALFALLVHFLLPLGKIEIMARLPSVLFGIFTIFAMYFTGNFIFSRKEGLAAAALAAFSPFLIRYSQYSRGYAAYAFFALISLYYFLKATETNQIRFWSRYTISITLTVYTHLAGLFILPSFAVYTAVNWLCSRFSFRDKSDLKNENIILSRFIIFTLIFIVLAFLLYLPDENIHSFLQGSSKRVSGQNPFSYLFNYLSQKIFISQIEAIPPLHYFFLAAIILGIAGGLKTHTKKTLFLLLYVILPFILFIAVNPRSVNIQSAERYLIFFLPVMFILIAKGFTMFAQGVKAVFLSFRIGSPDKQHVLNVTLLIMVFAALFSFNYRHYYLYFWKFGSYPVKKAVNDYLRREVKKDALIYFDGFPASGLDLIISPLIRNGKKDHSENPVRENIIVTDKETDLMIFRSILGLKYYIRSKIPIWAVSAMNRDKREKLVSLARSQPGIKANNLDHYAVICLESPEESVESKLNRLIDIYLKMEPDTLTKRQLYLLSAKVNLYNEQINKAVEALNAADSIPLKSTFPYLKKSSYLQRGFEFLLGLDKEKIIQSQEDIFYFQEIAREFFLIGEKFLTEKKYESAAQVYLLSFTLNKIRAFDISNRLVRIANVFLINDLPDKASEFFKKALELNPQRYELSFLLAETYKAAGFSDLSEQVYRGMFEKKGSQYQKLLSQLMEQESTAFIWKTESDWRLVMLSGENAIFSGQIKCDKNIKDIEPILFKKEDSIAYSENRVRFSFRMDKRRVKIIRILMPSAVKIELDLKINGRNIGNIALVE